MRSDKTRSGSRSLLAGCLVIALLLAPAGMLAAQDELPPETAAPAPNPPAKAAPAKASAAQSPSSDARASSAPNAPSAASSQSLPDRNSKHKPAPAGLAASAPATPAPVAPPPPDWPINDKPVAATVVWDSHGLRIDASNSSLDQILKDVSTDTGAKVEGLGADQRVFGTYGPGPARDVLSELLDGAGYNVLMIGDQGEGTPREIVLSAPPTGPAPTANNNRNLASEEEYEPEPEPPPPPEPMPVQAQPQQPAPQPGPPIRTPQQIYQEMQQRQQQMQQQQNENQPPNNQQ